MSRVHLNSEDPFPEPTEGLLRLYSMKYCPFAHRTRLVLTAKDIPHEIVNINLADKPSWFIERTKVGKAPTLEIDGKIIFESITTSDYLDEAYPENKLHPQDPVQKAMDKNVLEHALSKVTGNYYGMLMLNTDKDKLFSVIEEGLDLLEAELQGRGTEFFGGDKPSMLDYMVYPFFERLPVIEVVAGEPYKVPTNKTPELLKWMDSMKSDPVVGKNAQPTEAYVNIYKGFSTGKFDYD